MGKPELSEPVRDRSPGFAPEPGRAFACQMVGRHGDWRRPLFHQLELDRLPAPFDRELPRIRAINESSELEPGVRLGRGAAGLPARAGGGFPASEHGLWCQNIQVVGSKLPDDKIRDLWGLPGKSREYASGERSMGTQDKIPRKIGWNRSAAVPKDLQPFGNILPGAASQQFFPRPTIILGAGDATVSIMNHARAVEGDAAR